MNPISQANQLPPAPFLMCSLYAPTRGSSHEITHETTPSPAPDEISTDNSTLSPVGGIATPDLALSLRMHQEGLKKHKPSQTIDSEVFALIHGDAFLRDSPLDGGNPRKLIEFYLQSLQTLDLDARNESLLSYGHGYPVTALQNDLNDSLASLDAMTNRDHHAWLHAVSKGLAERRRFVMPLIYRGRVGEPGHVCGCILEKKNSGEIECRLLNKGEGANEHPLAERGDAFKMSYTFLPIVIPSADVFALDSELGKRLFELLAAYQNDPSPSEMQNYKTRDIYELFMILGKTEETVSAPTKEEGVTLQRSGTCPEQFVKLLTRDLMLHGDGVSKEKFPWQFKQFKRSVLIKKFDSLLMAYHQARGSDALPPALLMEAAGEFALSVDKNVKNGLLSREDFIKCHALVELIFGLKDYFAPVYNFPFPPLLETYKNVLPLSEWIETKKKDENNKIGPFSAPYPRIEKPKPGDLLDYLSSLSSLRGDYVTFVANKKREDESFFDFPHKEPLVEHLFYSAIRTLPVPGRDDYWDRVPAKDVERCIELLGNIASFYTVQTVTAIKKDKKLMTDRFPYFMLAQATVLAITYTLARRCPAMRLDNFSLDIDLEKISPKLLLFVGEDAVRFKQLKEYFTAARQGFSNFLFGFRCTRSICFETLVRAYEKGDRSTPALQHLHYLMQFIDQVPNETTLIGKLLRLASTKFKDLTSRGSLYPPKETLLLPPPYYLLQRYAQSLYECAEDYMGDGYIMEGTKRRMCDPYKGYSSDPSNKDEVFEYEVTSYSSGKFEGTALEDQPLENILFKSSFHQPYTTENELLLHPVGSEENTHHFDPSTYNDLKKILYKNELRIGSLVKFCEDQFYLAEHADIKKFIEYAALKSTPIIEKVQREPLMAENLRKVVDAHISYNSQPNHYKDALYWIRLAYHIETHIAKGLEKEISEERIEGLHKALDELKEKVRETAAQEDRTKEFRGYEYDLLLHHLYLESERTTVTDAHIEKIIPQWLLVNYMDSSEHHSPGFLFYAVQTMMARLASSLQKRLKEAPELAQNCLKRGPIPGTWKINNRGLFDSGWHCIDPIHGKIFYDDFQLKENELPDSIDQREKELITKLSGSPFNSLVHTKTSTWRSPDGSFEALSGRKSGSLIKQKKFAFTGTNEFYEYFPEAPFIPLNLSVDKQCWQSPSMHYFYPSELEEKTVYDTRCWKSPSRDHFYLIEQDGKTLYATGYWDKKAKEVKIIRAEDSAHLLDLGDTHLSRLLTRLSTIDNIRAWGQEKEDGEFELISFEIIDLDRLAFRVHNGKAYCENFSEYVISSQQALKQVGTLKGALILEKEGMERKRMVIVPFNKITGAFPLQGADVRIEASAPFSKNRSASFFAYEIDEKTDLLYSDSKEAMLYLTLILKLQGRYSEAVVHLDHLSFTQPLGETAWLIIEKVLSTANFTPAATALNLKLGMVILENHTLPVMDRKKGLLQKVLDGDAKNPDFYSIEKSVSALAHHYVHYLHIKGGREINPVSRSLRLTEKQELALITFLELFKNKSFFEDDVKLFMTPSFVDRKKKLELIMTAKKGNPTSYTPPTVTHTMVMNNHCEETLDSYFKETSRRDLWESLAWTYDYIAPITEIKITPRFSMHELGKNYLHLLKRALAAGNAGEVSPFDLDLLVLSQSVKPIKLQRWNDQAYHGLSSILSVIRRYPNDFKTTVNEERMEFGKLITSVKEVIKQIQEQPKQRTTLTQICPKVFSVESDKLKPLRSRERVDLTETGCTKNFSFPLESLFNAYMTRTKKEVLLGPAKEFALSHETIDPKKHPLACRLLQSLKQAHEQHNKNKTHFQYNLNLNSTSSTLTETLKQHATRAEMRMKSLKESMEALANLDDPQYCSSMDHKTHMEALIHRNTVNSGQIPRLTFDGAIIHSVLTRDAAILKRENPFLSDEQIQQIHKLAIEFMLEGSSIDQTKETLKLIQEGKMEGAAKVLGKERRYDPFLYPELLIYEYKTGLMLRTEPDQAGLLLRIFTLIFDAPQTSEQKKELSRLFFEFQAGGGKTKVIAAMIAARTIAEGKLAVFFSLPEIHDITKEDLRQAMFRAFGIKTEELSLTLDTKISEEDLKRVYKLIKKAWKEGICLIMTPETFHALHLDYQYSLDNALRERIKPLGAILDLFETRAVFQVDEGHRNVDALLMANVATGNPTPLPSEEREFLLKVYKFLIDDVDLLDLKNNKQALKTTEEVNEILERLAEFSLAELMVPVAARASTRSWLLNKHIDLPKWLEAWKNSGEDKLLRQARLLFFARGLHQYILPHAFSMVGQMDYGPSVHPGNEVAAPRVQKTATTSKFESPDVAAVLSTQHFRQSGLTRAKHMREVIQSLRYDVQKEKMTTRPNDLTPTEQFFLALQKNNVDRLALADISEPMLHNDGAMLRLATRIGKEPSLIDRYLRDYVLPHVVVYPHKYTSTASDLSHGAAACIHYSATLGAHEQYPYLEDVVSNYWEDTAFLSDVIQRGCLPHNRQSMWLEQKSPKELFEDGFRNDPSMFERLEGIINLGGWCKEFSNEEWAQQFLSFSQAQKMDHAGVIFTKEEINPSSGTVEKALFILLKSGELKKLKGSDLPKELERQGLQGRRFFKMYGANDTTGTDMVLASNAKTLVMLGEGVTLSSLAQAILRMRGFLNDPGEPETMQTMIWVGDQKLRHKIRAQVNGDSPEHLFLWALYREAERQEKAILVRAFQEIDFVIRHLIKREMKKCAGSPAEQIRIFGQHKNAFLYTLGRDLFTLFSSGVHEVETGVFLHRHAESFAAEANMALADHPTAQTKIQSIIAQTANIMPRITRKNGSDLSAGMKQNARVEQQQEVKQQQKATSTERYAPAPIQTYAQQELALTSAKLFDAQSDWHRSVNSFTGSTFYSEDLYIMHNASETIYKQTSPSNQRKPIERVMVVSDISEKEPRRRAFILSLDDAAEYLNQMATSKELRGLRVALFMSNGKLEGRNMSKEELDQLMQSPWFEEIVVHVGLFSGTVRNRDYVKQVALSNPSELKDVWREVQTSRLVVDPDTVDNAQMEAFLQLDALQNAQGKEQSWFDDCYLQFMNFREIK